MTAETEEKLSAEDIERTKKRQFEITNYAAVANAALVGIVKLFADDQIASTGFYQSVAYAILINFVVATAMWFGLVVSLTGFRFRLKKARIDQGKTAKRVWQKTVRDSYLFAYFLGAAWFGCYIALQYLLLRSELPLTTIWAWWPL